jgi:hypothetical protein
MDVLTAGLYGIAARQDTMEAPSGITVHRPGEAHSSRKVFAHYMVKPTLILPLGGVLAAANQILNY